jgi:hypothetical protein
MRRSAALFLALVLLIIGGPAMAAKGAPPPPPPPPPVPTKPPTQGTAPTCPPSTVDCYDRLVWSHSPALLLSNDKDLSGRGHTITKHAGQATTAPNGDRVTAYNSDDDSVHTDYTEVADADDLSIMHTGVFTMEAWFRPDVVNFTDYEAEGYVHWLGKGVPNQHEYVARIYNQSALDRPNRVSGYAFKLGGGLGAGSYFQDPMTAGEWIHFAVVVDTVNKDRKGWGTIRIYKNAVLRDTDSLGGSYKITPGNGTAPFRVGTRDFASFFEGAIGKVAVYNYDASEYLLRHNHCMFDASKCTP